MYTHYLSHPIFLPNFDSILKRKNTSNPIATAIKRLPFKPLIGKVEKVVVHEVLEHIYSHVGIASRQQVRFTEHPEEVDYGHDEYKEAGGIMNGSVILVRKTKAPAPSIRADS